MSFLAFRVIYSPPHCLHEKYRFLHVICQLTERKFESLTGLPHRYYSTATMKKTQIIDWIMLYAIWVVWMLCMPLMYLWALIKRE